MAKSTEIVKAEPTSIVPSGIDKFVDFASEGFIEDQTIKIGDPSREGNVGLYCGQLIGAGADIELADDGGSMPTWMFHPLTRDSSGKIVAQTNVIHSVICSSQLDAACKRAAALKEARGKNIFVVAEFSHQGRNRKEQPLNFFRVAIKEV